MHIENENIIRKLVNKDEVKNKLKKYRYFFKIYRDPYGLSQSWNPIAFKP